MKKVYLMGATGSIGSQVLEILRSKKKDFRLVSIACGENVDKAVSIIKEFNPKFVAMKQEKDAKWIQDLFPSLQVGFGDEGLIQAADFGTCKGLFINSLVGSIGLRPTIKAIERSRDILIANKETLVVGGEIVTRLAKENNVKLLPIDSEHSALFQILDGKDISEVKKITITASGGAFRDKTREELASVTIDDALKHPNWTMGKKITIDSATMVNKGLEVIEAHFLFGLPYEKIETILHRQSIIHSMVEFKDNSVLAQLGKSDMRIPIQYALTYPKRETYDLDVGLSLSHHSPLTFEAMDMIRFPCLKMAYDAGMAGGLMPTVYNASNEVAVELFLANKIKFCQIEEIISEALQTVKNIVHPSLDQILETDQITKTRILRNYT